MIKEVHWEFTRGCNFDCRTCLFSAGTPNEQELTLGESYEALIKFKKIGVERIYFTGGEAFFRKDFTKVMRKAVDLGLEVEVLTNGSYINALQLIKDLGVGLGVSLDGSCSIVNDSIRGRGSFDKALAFITAAIDLDIDVSLYFTITAINVEDIEKFLRLAKYLGIGKVHFGDLVFLGNALQNREALQVSNEIDIKNLVSKALEKVYSEDFHSEDDSCWATGSSVYMSSSGEMYLCTEISQRRPDLSFGNIKDLDLRKWEELVPSYLMLKDRRCPYKIYFSEHVAFTCRENNDCWMCPKRSVIDSLCDLEREFDDLYKGISGVCFSCKDRCCIGYTWVVSEEENRLLEAGIPIIEINEKALFIDSYSDEKGNVDLSNVYPRCRYLHSTKRWCSIHSSRPFVCHIYPLGIETQEDGKVVWALHKDCAFTRYLEKEGRLDYLLKRIAEIINRVSGRLLNIILFSYQQVDAISVFPGGGNRYLSLGEVKER